MGSDSAVVNFILLQNNANSSESSMSSLWTATTTTHAKIPRIISDERPTIAAITPGDLHNCVSIMHVLIIHICVSKYQWIKQLLKILDPAVFFSRRQLRNFENMTLVVRRREHFQVFLAIFLVACLSPKRGVLVQKNSLASCQRCCHSIEPRALTCPFKHSDLIAWSLLIGHPTHKYLWGRLCFVHVCCLLSTVMVTPAETRIMSTSLSSRRFNHSVLEFKSFSLLLNW